MVSSHFYLEDQILAGILDPILVNNVCNFSLFGSDWVWLSDVLMI